MGDMGGDLALSLTSEMLWTAIWLGAPVIGVTLIVGLLVSVLQVVTQIQEASLTFVPKLIAAAVVLLVFGGWMMSMLTGFATRVIGGIPGYF
jgi:flagellar biosynthetic protein FliQ